MPKEAAYIAGIGTQRQLLPERWPMSPFPFQPLKHNRLVVALARQVLNLQTRGLEKLIFTATTGRSGTLTLTKLFAAVPGCRAMHEPYPIMNGAILRAASYGERASVDRVYRRAKSVNIRRAAVGYRYYLEANHLFIKTFADNAVEDFGHRIAVVHLVRPAVEVANSIYQLRDYSGTERSECWWLDFKAPTNLLAMADILASDAEFSHPFYKGLWYWHEVEARIAAWRARMPHVKVVEFETCWLNDLGRLSKLLSELGIQYDTARLAALVGIQEHTKKLQKVSAALTTDEAQQKAQRFRALLEQMGLNERGCRESAAP